MKKIFLLSLALFIACFTYGQVVVTFQLDMDNLVKARIFNPDPDTRILVRGSFNNWEGNDYELKKVAKKNIYKATFQLEEGPGDTISYKFVVEKERGRIFWETNPYPDNPPYGNRQLVIKKRNTVLPPASFSYDEYFTYPVIFKKEKLQEDFLQFRDILESTHPALYDYTEKRVLDSLFERNYDRIDSEMEFRNFLILMTEVISNVGCGHSSLWVPGRFWTVAPEKLFPLKIYNTGEKIFVTGSYQGNIIPVGSEILSVNEIPIMVIMNRLENLTSSDAFNRSFRLAHTGQNFSEKYALAYGFPDVFQIEYRSHESTELKNSALQPVSRDIVQKSKPDRSELSFKIIEDSQTGVFTINTFAYYSRVDYFHGFVDSVFREIRSKGIENLVLDLRGNGGGDPFCASYLWAYLEPEPLPYFEDHYGRYDTLANPVPQPINHFEGNLLTLIDGNGFSTTGHFCGLLKYHKVGKFVGTELGSTYTCTGNATYPPIKNTGIMVGTARVMRYTAAVKDMDPRRGILPDYQVEVTQKDIVEGRDTVMEYALNLAGK